MRLFTIGFAKKSAEDFFTRLQKAGVRRVVDVRLNNTSQLAAFAKARDIEYFLRAIAGIEYVHAPDLAPTQDILDDFKKKRIQWHEYELRFAGLMATCTAAQEAARLLRDDDCLLCSEDTTEHCHRRLVAEYRQERSDGIEVFHL